MAALLVLPALGHADIYKYVDEKGVVHFTNIPTGTQYAFYMKESVVSEAPTSNNGSLSDLISHYADMFGLEAALVQAVIKVESNYNPNVVSTKGAQGLMQLIPETAQDMQVRNPFNPEENIRGGSRYLRLMLDQFNGNLDLALAAYNAGPGSVQRYGGIPPFDETRNYIQRVKKHLDRYRQGKDPIL
ncbi:lytic transglycosylase [Desulfuromonas versatilis]|uniref:Lytic transglycosylase n=1 Tax=Desulfuromonas versatilis TaxID=2802975 RepID=A0ABN6E147_9BACT|nr:lytic transglycosylase [Desulfuromonas versatilis]